MNNRRCNTVFWSWNKDMKHEEIKRQIEDMHNRNIRGFFIHSRAGLTIDYMGEEWFSAIKVCIDCAKEYHMEVWLYDEDGWPSGFGGGAVTKRGEDFWLKHLKCSYSAPNVNERNIVAKYRMQLGEYSLTHDDNAEMWVFYDVDRHYVDLMSKETTFAFIECTHEVYKKRFGEYFRDIIKGVFTDEPQLHRIYPWSTALGDEYAATYNTDIKQELWKLFVDGKDKNKFLYKFNKIKSKLFEENYIKVIADWCDENGLIFTGHLADEDGLCMSAFSTGGTMSNYANMQMPGIDFLGKRLTSKVLLKHVGSAKNIFNKSEILSETFGCCGWDTYFSDYAWMWAYQAAFGVNKACFHIGAYSIIGCRKRDYPAFFSYHETWWKEFKYLSDWIFEINNFLSGFTRKNDVLLISPLKNMFAFDMYDDRARYISGQFRSTVDALTEAQVNFDVADEHVLSKLARAENGRIVMNDCSYDYLILPDCESVTENVFRILKSFSDSGGKLIATNKLPKYIDFDKLFDSSQLSIDWIVINRNDLWKKYFDFVNYGRQVSVFSHDKQLLTNNTVTLNGVDCAGQVMCFIVNLSRDNSKYVSVEFAGDGQIFEYDFIEKKYIPLNTLNSKDKVRAYVGIDKKSSKCIVKREQQKVITHRNYVCGKRLHFDKVIQTEENSYTLDYAAFSVDGCEFSGKMPIIRMQEQIYEFVNKLKRPAVAMIKYDFNVEYIPENLTVYIEKNNSQKITVNGREIEPDIGNWWIDREILGCNISRQTVIGENSIVISNIVEPSSIDYNLNEVFETERNRFYYAVEFESIYLRGDFDLRLSGEIVNNAGYYSVLNPNFTIAGSSRIHAVDDITTQSRWFYRGRVRCVAKVQNRGRETWLKLSDVHTPVVSLYVNGTHKYTFINSYHVDISRFLDVGENEIMIELISSNRNLLGPHHHIKGENDFVGVNTFKGTKGYEDLIFNPNICEDTYVDSYSFVKFGIGDVVIEEYD